MADDLDFTKHFSTGYKVAEPVATEAQQRDVDKLGTIGAAALKDKGYYTRIVVQERGAAKKVFDPKSLRVLIVEDDDGTALLIDKTLQTFGCRTLRAGNRLEIAQALAQKPRPHLVLLDVLMPDANGFDVLNRIRRHPALEHLPVLLLTSLGGTKDISRGLLLGANGYITKPVLPSTLIEAVEAVAGGRPS